MTETPQNNLNDLANPPDHVPALPDLPVSGPAGDEVPVIAPAPEPATSDVPDAEPAAPRRKRGLLIAGIALAAVLVVAAAFFAGRLLNNTPGTTGVTLGPLGSGGDASIGTSIQVDMGDPAPELPTTASDASGQFVKRSDNVITISTGSGSVIASSDASGEFKLDFENPGPSTEIVVTKETKVYRDATFDDLKGSLSDASGKIQQKVAEGSVDEMGTSSMVVVWGRKSGDRIIADVLLYTGPIVLMAK